MSRFLKRQKRHYLKCCVCDKGETTLPRICVDCEQQCAKYICHSCFLGNNQFRCAGCVYSYFYDSNKIALKKLCFQKILTHSISPENLPARLTRQLRNHAPFLTLKALYESASRKERYNYPYLPRARQ